MGEGHKAIMDQMWTVKRLFYDYFNVFGRIYIQIIILCRVLVCAIFIDDLFDEGEDTSKLTCDTQQVGCELTCLNRFSPVTHKKIWEAELFMVLFTITVFTIFNHINKGAHRRHQRRVKENPDSQPGFSSNMKFREKVRRGGKGDEHTIVTSKITKFGYIVMLVVRLVCEIIFLYVENQLGKHQSQNVEFWDAFWLKEFWVCPTNNVDVASQQSIDKLMPPANRSSIFWTDELNVACMQNKVTVTCWIEFSRMKSYGLWFMYAVLCVSTILTVCELCFELTKSLCCKKSRRSRADSESLMKEKLSTME